MNETGGTTSAPRSRPRLTHHRQTVWEVVTAQREHLTAAQIYDAVRRRDARMAVGTVYTALHHLVTAGLLATVQRPDGVVAYDRTTAPHDHALCRLCGYLADAPPDPVREQAVARAYALVAGHTGFTVEGHRVAFVGLCPACRAAQGGA